MHSDLDDAAGAALLPTTSLLEDPLARALDGRTLPPATRPVATRSGAARDEVLRVGTGAAHLQHGLALGSDGIRYHLQQFRCISLRSAAVHCVRGTVYQPECAGFRNWSTVKRILS